MLDESPRQEPLSPPPDSNDQAANGAIAEPVTGAAPVSEAATSGPAAGTAVSATSLIRTDMSDAWARLDQSARLLVGASAAAIAAVIVGLPLSVWDSAPFALLVLVAGVTTAVTGWFGASPAFRDLPIPRATIELVASYAVAILAFLKVGEVVFDFAVDGVVGLVVAGSLLAAAAAQLLAAQRRGAVLPAFNRGDQGARIAAIGFILVVVGWALNLTMSFWTMGQAALPLAVLTIAALTVAEAPRIEAPIPVAWVGAGIGVFGAILALANWGDLTSLGRTEIVLGPADFIGPIAYIIGVALIIAGGVLSGRAVWAAGHAANSGPFAEG